MAARTGIAAMSVGLIALLAAGPPAWSQAPTPIPAPLGDPPPPLSDAAFDAAFQCPEALADERERRAALVGYFVWAETRHPDWSVAGAIEFRKTLLVHHQCAASLRDLADYAKREH
jgi:hypothetical protein